MIAFVFGVIAFKIFSGSMLYVCTSGSTKTGSALDAIAHTENGYLVNYNSITEFVDGINFLLTHDQKKIGEKGRTIAKSMYSFEKMWESHISLYTKAVSS